MNTRAQPKCFLIDWTGTDDRVAEGHILSSDPQGLVHGIILGSNCVKVLVETSTKLETHLWRPASDMSGIEGAVEK